MKTRITQLFDIEHPILLGGMMWLSNADLVAAVVNAGAMGFITARSSADPEAFRDELQKCLALTKGKPFGVNLTLSKRETHNTSMAQFLDVALQEGVRYFETAGLPPTALMPSLQESQSIVMHKCAHIRHAISAEKLGVDAICLVGMEEGGHPGNNLLPTFVNGAFALERLTVPLVIGGGIGHGRQIAAALALGADGVVMGSRFTAASETPAHLAYKQKILEVDEHCSVTVLSSLGSTWRVLNNETAQQVAELEAKGANHYSDFGELIKGYRSKEFAYTLGQIDIGMLSLGPAAGFTRTIEPAGDIVKTLMQQCIEELERTTQLLKTVNS
ncbi:NAD(P)H-dependent flavin oxidoreductase [Orrella sp. 11846]|uniref:NAD(P)H-dependent flavin oxidoreductase n=1 Tax=Orrella sp. 11846 TaxID=3409913 RepID=UPI003B5A30DC